MRRNTKERGFTFIEVLVVMGIIAVLVGLSVAGVTYFLHTRLPQAQTGERINKVAGLIGQWKLHFEKLPPMSPNRLPPLPGGTRFPSMPDSFNVPIEVLFQALNWPGVNVEAGFSADELSNTDNDEWDKPTFAGAVPYEIRDKWDNPLVYFVYQEYSTAAENPPTYILVDGTEVEPVPWKYADESRGFAEPHGFQLFSMGPDGVPNTEDDIKSWE